MSSLFKKLVLLTFLSLFFLISPAFSQQKKLSADSIAFREAFVLRQKLSLSSKQQRDVEVAALRFHRQIQAYRQNTTKGSKLNVKLLNTLHSRYQKTIVEILTDVQYEKYQQLIADAKSTFKARSEARGMIVKTLGDE